MSYYYGKAMTLNTPNAHPFVPKEKPATEREKTAVMSLTETLVRAEKAIHDAEGKNYDHGRVQKISGKIAEALTMEYENAARTALRERYEQVLLPTAMEEELIGDRSKRGYFAETDNLARYGKPRLGRPQAPRSMPMDLDDFEDLSCRLVSGLSLKDLPHWINEGEDATGVRRNWSHDVLAHELKDVLSANCLEAAEYNGRELSSEDLDGFITLETVTLAKTDPDFTKDLSQLIFMGETVAKSRNFYDKDKRYVDGYLEFDTQAIRRATAKFLMTVLAKKDYKTWEKEHAEELEKAAELTRKLNNSWVHLNQDVKVVNDTDI